MLKTAAAVDPDGKRLMETVTSNDVQPKGGGAMRFAYATGSRPLDGYTIKRGIGVGGFGEVYFAVSDAGKEVAIKCVQRSMDVEIRGVRQCLNLKHPNLIALYDIRYDDDGQAWVVMEYVSGDCLKDVADRYPDGMPLQDVKHWFSQIAAGVIYLHDHGIVHRDLKPGNIFCDGDTVKIGDYGLSKYMSCSRRSGQTESVGTFHYMAPEIGKGVYGKEIDIYALGIILFELLTGRVPFEGESSQEIIMKHLTADPNLESIPDCYRGIIRRALFKDPEQRFANVGEMLAAFHACDGPAAQTQVAAATNKPPVRWNPGGGTTANAAASPVRETLFIMDEDETEDEGIKFGPLNESPSARSVADPPSVSTTARRTAPATRPEPIANAIRTGSNRLTTWWAQSNLSLPLKVVLLICVAFALILNSEWLIPLAVVLGVIYLVYYGVYSLMRMVHGSPTARANASPNQRHTHPASADAGRPHATATRRHVRRSNRTWQQEARSAMARKYPSQRFAELNSSVLKAAIVSGVLAFLMLLLSDLPLQGTVYTWSLFAWLTFTCTTGAWAVLGVSKAWEKSDADEVHRRFVMLIVGLLIGALAFLGSSFLGLQTADYLVVSVNDAGLWKNMYGPSGQPGLAVYLIHFAALMLVLRWWNQSDPVRPSRLSLMAVGAAVLCSWVLSLIWPFPQPWGIMLAAAMSVVVQLSSPWINSSQRAQYRRQALDA